MKTTIRIIASLCALLGAAACQQYEIDTQMTPEKAAANIRMTCDALDSYNVPATNPGNVTFNISSNTPWTVTRSNGADWITVTPSSSASSALISDVVVSFANNTSTTDRSATITVVGEKIRETKVITFTQSRQGKLYVTPVAQNFADAGGPLSFTINTNQDWEIRTDVSWLSFNRESGTPDPDGRTIRIIATAEANEGIARTATVTVKAGEDEESFNVTQNGFTFEIVTPAKPELPRLGGSLVIEVNTAATWTPATDTEGWTVEKTDASHFKVTAPVNNKFAVKTGKVSISTASGAYDELSLTQDVNFTFENADVQADGSVKLYGDKKSRVTLIDPARYVSFNLTMGQVSFDDKAEFVLNTHDANGSEMQCQIRLGAGKNRLRTNGGVTDYNTQDIGITVAELNAITSYRMDFVPNAADATKIDLEFFYNGTSKAKLTCASPYAGNTETAHYFFGTEDATEGSASWFIVKSCDVTFIAE